MRLSHLFGAAMRHRGSGHIIHIGSITSQQVSPNLTAYAASKHGVHGFTQSLRAESQGAGMRVTEILPGMVEAEFAVRRWHGDKAKAAIFYETAPAVLRPDDVAACVLFAVAQPPRVSVDQIIVTPISPGGR